MSVLQKITDLLFPPTCAFCGNRAEIYRTLCRDCYAEFVREKFEKCPICGKFVKECECGCDFLAHTKTEIDGRRFLTLTFYKSKRSSDNTETRLTERMIFRLKEKCDFTEFFAAELSKEVKKLFERAGEDLTEWIITYAPRSKENLIKYGFDQSEEIVRKMSRELGIRWQKTVSRGSGDVQKKLSAEERRTNAEESIYTDGRKVESGGKYLLFDDIITTGATVMTVSRNLYFHGAAKVFPITIARTMPSVQNAKDNS